MRIALFLFLALTVAACDSSETSVQADSRVLVAYEGRLTNGTVFDQNDRATFTVSQLIPGFQTGIIGMVEGETRTFEVPPEQGYGNRQVGPIPPNSTLIFEVTLLEIL